MNARRFLVSAVVLLASGVAAPLWAANIWNGSAWSESLDPGDDVEIQGDLAWANLGGITSFGGWTHTSGTFTFATNTTLNMGAVTLNGGSWTHQANSTTAAGKVNSINVAAASLNVGSAFSITADAKGYSGLNGPAAGGTNFGASHGGKGGRYNNGFAKDTYGSVTAPADLGSGGDSGNYGGGAISLTTSGLMTVDGVISANGANNTVGDGGAAAGGSISLNAATFAGTTGVISANGGTSTSGYSGGGGGGRIALVTGSASLGSVALRAYGGDGSFNGTPSDARGASAGTIYLKKAGDTYGELLVDNNDEPRTQFISNDNNRLPLTTPILSGAYTFDRITATNAGLPEVAGSASVALAAGGTLTTDANSRLVVGAGTFVPPATFTLANATLSFAGTNTKTWNTDLTVAAGGILTHEPNYDIQINELDLTVNGNVTVDAGGAINVLGKGYEGQAVPKGPAPGGSNWGGGHAGQGGYYNGTGPSVNLYGSILAPVTLGSGGLANVNGGATARGGGAVILTVNGALTNNGTVTANGDVNATIANTSYNGGGGAGGSIFITATALAGSGSMSASGGSPNLNYSGGGGGGRIAIVTGGGGFGSNSFAAAGSAGGQNYSAHGTPGASGTVYLQDAATAEARIGNNGLVSPYVTLLPAATDPGDDLSAVTFMLSDEADVRMTADVLAYALDLDSTSGLNLNGFLLTLYSFTDRDGAPFTAPGVYADNGSGFFDGVAFNGGSIEILLSPVIPEPASLALLAAAGLVALRRRRRA